MSEFNNRISAQRDILLLVNSMVWHEELLGLSSGAIDRWIRLNQLGDNLSLVPLIRKAAEKLFFLANKSQEQVTKEYYFLSEEVSLITNEIKNLISHQS